MRSAGKGRGLTFVDGAVGYNIDGVTELERPDVSRRCGHPVLAERAREFFARALAKTLVLSHVVGSVLRGRGEPIKQTKKANISKN